MPKESTSTPADWIRRTTRDINWRRVSTDARTTTTGNQAGAATITPGPPLTIHEKGRHTAGDIAPLGTPVRQSWSLEYAGDRLILRITTIAVELAALPDGSWRGESRCGDDTYRVTLAIDEASGTLQTQWHVLGPNKHYTLHTTYQPADTENSVVSPPTVP